MKLAAINKLAMLIIATLLWGGLEATIPGNADAKSRVCVKLERQLASLRTGGSFSQKAVRRSVRGQKKQISIASRKMTRLGCARQSVFFLREAHPSCRGLRRTLQKMKSNLSKLQSSVGLGTKKSVRRQRARIVRSMKSNQCSIGASAKRNASISDQIFSKSTRAKRRREADRDRRKLKSAGRSEVSTERRLRNYNTVRTLCVRTCDGYYFPVSFSTKPGSVEGDQQACSNLCPGTEMELFYHKTTGENAENMVSVVDQKAYTSLKNAFAYRKAFNPNCACNYRLAAKGEASVQSSAGASSEERARQPAALSIPIWRPDRNADPETLANRKGGLTQKVLGTMRTNNVDHRVAQDNRIRVIGESFLPAQ